MALLTLASLSEFRARAEGVVAERFQPAATSGGYISTERPETAGPWRLGVGLVTSYARSPLRIVAGNLSSSLIDHSLAAEAMISLGLWRFGEVGLSVPATLYQEGPGLTAPAAMRDLKLHLKGRLWSHKNVGLGLLGTFYFPTGDSTMYAGTGQVAFAPRVLLEGRFKVLRAGLNAGFLLRQTTQEGEQIVSHELNYSLGIGVRPHRLVELLGDLYGSTALLTPWQSRGQSPLEASAAAALSLGDFNLSAGGGAGVVGGYGAPLWRLFLSLRYQQQPRQQLVARARQVPAVQVQVEVQPTPPPPPPPPMEIAPPEVAVQPTTEFRGDAEIVVTDTELIPNKAIFFDSDRARIHRDFVPVLDAIAAMLKAHPELGNVRINGHSDAVGPEEHNRELSYRRALAVRDALVTRGIDIRRLVVTGFGAALPVEDNSGEKGRSKNRRVVFYHHASPDKQTATRDSTF